jgi:hypothetical protein
MKIIKILLLIFDLLKKGLETYKTWRSRNKEQPKPKTVSEPPEPGDKTDAKTLGSVPSRGHDNDS